MSGDSEEISKELIKEIQDNILNNVSYDTLYDVYGKDSVIAAINCDVFKAKENKNKLERELEKESLRKLRQENKVLAAQRQKDILNGCELKDANLSNQINNLTSYEAEHDKSQARVDAGNTVIVDGSFTFAYPTKPLSKDDK